MSGPMRPWSEYRELPLDQMQMRARALADEFARRRSVRDFSPRPVPREVLTDCLRAAATAPSGANRQPWHFVVVDDARTRQAIRRAAEQQEQEFYERRAPPEWLEALQPLGTDADKPFLECATLIVIFYERYGVDAAGERFKTYYAPESVGIATGILISALHQCGLATLTHTPSPMKFLREILRRPVNESPFLLLATGYPAPGCQVPDISRKPLDQVVSWFEP